MVLEQGPSDTALKAHDKEEGAVAPADREHGGDLYKMIHVEHGDRFRLEGATEGCCVLYGPGGTTRSVYVVRHKMESSIPLRCKHQPSPFRVEVDVELPYSEGDAVSLLVLLEREGDATQSVVYCDRCFQPEKHLEGFGFFLAGRRGRPLASENQMRWGPSVESIRSMMYAELCNGSDVSYLGKVEVSKCDA
jgi:hypothetical protein